MTDSYKVRTSQLPNFHDENMKRNEELKTFPSSPSHLYSILPALIAISSYQTFRQILSVGQKIEGTMHPESPMRESYR